MQYRALVIVIFVTYLILYFYFILIMQNYLGVLFKFLHNYFSEFLSFSSNIVSVLNINKPSGESITAIRVYFLSAVYFVIK